MRLFLRERVENMEALEEFVAGKDKAIAASARGKAAVMTKHGNAFKEAMNLVLEVPALEVDALLELTRERLKGDLFLDESAVLHSAAVEILMEMCEPYLWQLDDMFGRQGVKTARDVLRRRLLLKIASVYPDLEAECQRRLKEFLGAPVIETRVAKNAFSVTSDYQEDLFSAVNRR